MNQQTLRSARRSFGGFLMEFLGSMNLAITLLVAISVASIIGTVLQQNQPYADYLFKFGPFWFELFKGLGLYDVYRSWWFLALLAFLIVSTSVCVIRNAPRMLSDMRHFRTDVQEKSLRSFHQKQEWRLDQDRDSAAAAARRSLEKNGYRVRLEDKGEYLILAAMKGSWNRLGYLLTHVAIVVICVGGVIDGNVPLKFAEWSGKVQVEKRDLPVSEVPKESVVSADNSAFRGNVSIPENDSAGHVFLNVRDGYLVQKLPFSLELKDFRVEHYPTGQPKSFESDVVLTDPELGKPITRTISVNHPLVYKDFAIYQASFSDGGTKLKLQAWSLDAPGSKPLSFDRAIYQSVKLPTVRGPLTLELTDFKPYNVFPADEGSGQKFKNYGPSLIFKLRNSAGEAVEFVNYLTPVVLNNASYFMSGMRTTVADSYKYLYIPADPKGGVDRFMRLRAAAADPVKVRSAVVRRMSGMGGPEVFDAVTHMVDVFNRGGMDGLFERVKASVPEKERDAAMQSYIAVLQNVFGALYLDILQEEGIDTRKGVSQEDSRFFEDALDTLAGLPAYGSPLFIYVADYNHIEASVLQITRAPGQNVVYLGFVMLMLGVFFMFYLHHRRVWVRIVGTEAGTELLMAGNGNRNRVEFAKEFERLSHDMAAHVGRHPT